MIRNPLKKLIRIFKELIGNSRKTVILQEEAFALIQLNQLFKESIFIPITIWSILPSTVLHVINDIVINNKKMIIEFGSGFSTIYIAQLLKIYRLDSKFICVESNKNWAKELNQLLNNYKLNEYVTVVYPPITSVKSEIAFKEQ